MPFREVFDPQRLAALTRVLDDYCRRTGIPDKSEDRDDIALLIIQLYRNGVDEDQIMSMLPMVQRRTG